MPSANGDEGSENAGEERGSVGEVGEPSDCNEGAIVEEKEEPRVAPRGARSSASEMSEQDVDEDEAVPHTHLTLPTNSEV